MMRQAMDRQGGQDESSDELEDAIANLFVPGSDTDDDLDEKEDNEMEGGEEIDDSGHCLLSYLT